LWQLLPHPQRLNSNFTELDVRRAFNAFQLMTILQENHHSFLIVEHDPQLYEDAKEMVEYMAQALGKHQGRPPSCSMRRRWALQRNGQGPREGRGEYAGGAGYSGGILMRRPGDRREEA